MKITEEQARQMEAGSPLNRICAGWMEQLMAQEAPRRYSTSWAEAGPLMDAMDADVETTDNKFGVFTFCFVKTENDIIVVVVEGRKDRKLAIARACAILVARGITREDLP